MRILIKLINWLFWASVLLALFVPQGLYLYGLNYVEEELKPPEVLYNERVWSAYRKWQGDAEENRFRKFNPYTLLGSILIGEVVGEELNGLQRADFRVYVRAATRRVRSSENLDISSGDRYLANATALIYVSRNWTLDQIISEILSRQHYGRQIYGLSDAAKFYFGVEYTELNEEQLFALFLVPLSPKRYDLWCRLESNLEDSASLMKRRGVEYTATDLKLLPNLDESCERTKP